ncbi:glycosyltransferase family 2 protein [Paenibacillus sp. LjRoot153]|uniref:glycosyltransferase family 2 protein n=1 Tax=Paenibacillus sp. LjRoot153 TaxID=3342270 RepID=UPI003ECD8C7E
MLIENLPKVSIITVSFNSKETIEDTINSVLTQTYTNIEYIIIDGNSTDGTVDIIKKYQSYITRWISEPDNGIYDAFNKGISMATGEIIGIVNSDDYLESYALDDVVKIYLKSPEVDVIHGNMRIVNDFSNKMFITSPRSNLVKERFITMPVCHPATFITKKCYLEEGLYNKYYKISSDYEFILRLIKKNKKFIYVDKVLTNMREGGASANYVKGFKEAKKIKEEFGCGKISALYYFVSSCVKKSIGDQLLKYGLFRKWYEKYKVPVAD